MELDNPSYCEETNAKKRLIYRCPLPRKKQRVVSKKQRNGKVRVYTEEQKLLYVLRKMRGIESWT